MKRLPVPSALVLVGLIAGCPNNSDKTTTPDPTDTGTPVVTDTGDPTVTMPTNPTTPTTPIEPVSTRPPAITSGSGRASSPSYQVILSTGAPAPMGTSSGPDTTVQLGPAATLP